MEEEYEQGSQMRRKANSVKERGGGRKGKVGNTKNLCGAFVWRSFSRCSVPSYEVGSVGDSLGFSVCVCLLCFRLCLWWWLVRCDGKML